MALAIFDLDNTLISGDSDHAWGDFLVAEGIVDKKNYKHTNDKFYADYKCGKFDIFAYLDFALAPLASIPPEQLKTLHAQFMSEKIEPLVLTKGVELIAHHRALGHPLMIITATNRFITEPIARRLDISTLLATDPEMVDGRFTGRLDGTPCYHSGKVTRLNAWMAANQHSLDNSYFYSDSYSDLPLLELVTHPHAVDPDERLKKHASEHNWPIISLR